MKICFSIKPDDKNGPNIFIGHLIKYLKNRGHSISYGFPSNCDIFFISAGHFIIPPEDKRNYKLIQRLDGVWHNLSMPYKEANQRLSYIHSRSDGVIYQSNFSKRMCDKYLNSTSKTCKTTIIPNGTDPNIFKEYPKGDKKRIITYSNWRPHKRLNSTIDVFKHLDRDDVELVVIGTNDVYDDSSIKYVGKLSNTEIPKYLGSSDLYLFLSWLDNCPNSVIESIVSNVPVICTNEGGTHEIVKNNGIVVNNDPEYDLNPCYLYSPPGIYLEHIVNAVNTVLDCNEPLVRNREPYLIENIGKRYEDFMINILDE